MRSAAVLFLLAALLGASGVAVTAYASLAKRRHDARAGWSLRPVVVASVDLEAGSRLTLEQVSQRSVPEQFVVPEMVTPDQVGQVAGRVLTSPLLAGDPVLMTDFADRTHAEALVSCVRQVTPAVEATAAQAAEAALQRFEPPHDSRGEAEEPPMPATDAQGGVLVVTALTGISEGTVLEPRHLVARSWPKALVTASFVGASDGRHLLGRRALFPIQKGDAVLWQLVDVPDAPATFGGCVAAVDKAVDAARVAEAPRAARAWTWPGAPAPREERR